MKTIKEKSVELYLSDGFGGFVAISKNAMTRLKNKMKKGIRACEVYRMPARSVERGKK